MGLQKGTRAAQLTMRSLLCSGSQMTTACPRAALPGPGPRAEPEPGAAGRPGLLPPPPGLPSRGLRSRGASSSLLPPLLPPPPPPLRGLRLPPAAPGLLLPGPGSQGGPAAFLRGMAPARGGPDTEESRQARPSAEPARHTATALRGPGGTSPHRHHSAPGPGAGTEGRAPPPCGGFAACRRVRGDSPHGWDEEGEKGGWIIGEGYKGVFLGEGGGKMRGGVQKGDMGVGGGKDRFARSYFKRGVAKVEVGVLKWRGYKRGDWEKGGGL